MGVYWPSFEFSFTLDVRRLLPHIAAIEAYSECAVNGILPPSWREPDDADLDELDDLPDEETARIQIINRRKHQLLLRNASETQAWVRERFVPGSSPLSIDDILAMHRMAAEESGVLADAGGIWRSCPVVVGKLQIHGGAPAEKLPRLMEEYVRFVNSKQLRSLPPAIHSLVGHFFFTTIHPFADGNGRLCRLISAAILFQRGYKGHGFYAFSRYFYQNAAQYHSLLHECWQQPLPFDLTLFVAFGIEGLALELQDIRTFVKMKLNRVFERPMPSFETKARRHLP